MHVTGASFAIRVAYAIEPKRKGRMSALDQPAFFRDIMRQRKKCKSAFELCIGTWCLFVVDLTSKRTCGKHLLRVYAPASEQALHCTALICSTSHTRDRWEFRDPCLVLDQTEAEEWKKDCLLPICPPSLRKIRDCSIFLFLSFFFFFFGDQVASWLSPTRKVSRQWRLGDR